MTARAGARELIAHCAPPQPYSRTSRPVEVAEHLELGLGEVPDAPAHRVDVELRLVLGLVVVGVVVPERRG